MTLGETIRFYRKDVFGWTQKKLGDELGVSPSCIGHYEHDRHDVSPEILRKLCEIFSLPASTLLGTTGQEGRVLPLRNKASDGSSKDFTASPVAGLAFRESSFPPHLTTDMTFQEYDRLLSELLNVYVQLEVQDKRRLIRHAVELNEKAIKARKDSARKTK